MVCYTLSLTSSTLWWYSFQNINGLYYSALHKTNSTSKEYFNQGIDGTILGISRHLLPLLQLNTIHLPGLLHVSKVYIWGLLGTLPYLDPSECHKPHYEVLYYHEFEIQDGPVHKLLPWNSNSGSTTEKHFKI